jgi:hypothetical protein
MRPSWPPDSSTRRTASVLNSSVNLRRGRFTGGDSFFAGVAGFFDIDMIDTHFQGPSTLPRGVRQTGAAPFSSEPTSFLERLPELVEELSCIRIALESQPRVRNRSPSYLISKLVMP